MTVTPQDLQDKAEELVSLAYELADQERKPKTAFWVVKDSRVYQNPNLKKEPSLDYWGPFPNEAEARTFVGNAPLSESAMRIVEVPLS